MARALPSLSLQALTIWGCAVNGFFSLAPSATAQERPHATPSEVAEGEVAEGEVAEGEVAEGEVAEGGRSLSAAARAYDRAGVAFEEEDFPTAARWFETAHELSPSPVALLLAIRSHRAAGNLLRSGTLSLRFLRDFPDEEGRAEAETLVREARPYFVRVEVSCDAPCSLELDGALVGPAFFLEPGSERRLRAVFPSGHVDKTVEGEKGTLREVHFEAPAPSEDVATAIGVVSVQDKGQGLRPGLFVGAVAMTLAAGGLLLWSGLDTQRAAERFEEVAAEETAQGDLDFPRATTLLRQGEAKERRTNALIGVAGTLATSTVIIALFTRWGRDGDEANDAGITRLRGVAGATAHGATFGLRGRFP